MENKKLKCKQQTGTVREHVLKKFSKCKLRIIKSTLKKINIFRDSKGLKEVKYDYKAKSGY